MTRKALLGCQPSIITWDNGISLATYLNNQHAVPDIFHEAALTPDGTGGLVPWVGTSLENPLRDMRSRRQGDGSCRDILQAGNYYPAAQLTDESGFLVDDINDLYPGPLRIEAQ